MLRSEKRLKLFCLDDDNLQQYESASELRAKLQETKISYKTVDNESYQFCSVHAKVLHLSWESREMLGHNFKAAEQEKRILEDDVKNNILIIWDAFERHGKHLNK